MNSARNKTDFRKLRLVPLLAATYFMVSGGPYGLEDIIGDAGYGLALVILLVVPLLWTLPTAAMLGELASSVPDEGGFYAWVRRAMGPFWGFQEAWLSLAASVFDMAIYPTMFVAYLSHVWPALAVGHRWLWLEVAVVALSAAWNLRGAAAVGEGSVGMWLLALCPFVVLVVLAVWKGAHGPHAAVGPPAKLDVPAAILVAMWNYMGWDNATTIAAEVENPQRTYPRVMGLAFVMVVLTYTVPTAAVWWAGISPERFTTGAWADAAAMLGGTALAFSVVVTGSVDSMGTFNALTLSYTRLPYAMACDGLLPQVLTRRNRFRVPWVALVVCAVCWALALGLTFERLISIDVLLWGMSLMLEFAALVVLRRREPELLRPFRVPGPQWVLYGLGAGPFALTIFALWAARSERVGPMPASAFALGVALVGPLLYWLAVRLRRREETL